MTDWKMEFDEAMSRIYEYMYLDNRYPKEYYPGISLMPREVHTLEMVFHHPGVNTTELSTTSGILKGTISKIMRRLEEMELVESYKTGGNLKEVHYRTTALGRKVFDAHMKFHEGRLKDAEFYNRFDAMQTEKKEEIVDMLNRFGDMMKEYCEQRQSGEGK